MQTVPVQETAQARVPMQKLRETVSELASSRGFDLAGVAPAWAHTELDYFPQWVEEGRAGEMEYLKRRNDDGAFKRSSLQAALPWARSVIVCAVSYDSAAPLSIDAAPEGSGWIARYAHQGNAGGGAADYHTVLLKKLRDLEEALHRQLLADGIVFESRSYVDTGPLIERVFAQYAGIGWTGKNTCILNQELGSFLFLATIVTSLELLDLDLHAQLQPDRCGSCTRCIDACPTNALDQPYRMDASLCIAYLTIEKRGEIPTDPPGLREGIGRNVFGCDICQDVCPWNQRARRRGAVAARGEPAATVREELVNPSLAWLGRLDPQGFKRLFRGSPLERTKWHGLMRNVAIAMGNAAQEEYLPQLSAWAAMQLEPALAEAANWAIAKIRASSPAGVFPPQAPD